MELESMARESIAKIRADRIREEIPILKVLYDYGYGVRLEGGEREQQFCCDLHGDGRDTKPSARVYPASNSFFCFACGATRDAITLVRAKENLSFWDAVRTLEHRYGLPPLDIDADLIEREHRNQKTPLPDLTAGKDYTQMKQRLSARLDSIVEEKSLPVSQTLAFWEAFDQIVYKVAQNIWPEKQGCELFTGLLDRITKTLTQK